jgi:uncharacterized membrane protein YedE/YeeE
MGIGMSVAAGCPFRLITRASEGELSAVTAIGGFIVGITAFAYALPFLYNFFAPYTFTGPNTFVQLIGNIIGGR